MRRNVPYIHAEQAQSGKGPFDSRLEFFKNGTEAALTLIFRYHLNYVDVHNIDWGFMEVRGGQAYARDFNGKAFPLAEWTRDEMIDFKHGFESMALAFWNGKFWLRPELGWLDVEEVGSGGRWWCRPIVECRLAMLELGKTGKWHNTFNVVKIDWQELTKRYPGHNAPGFRSDNKHLEKLAPDVVITEKQHYTDDECKDQVEDVAHDTIAHEVGHCLGLDHIMALLVLKQARNGSVRPMSAL